MAYDGARARVVLFGGNDLQVDTPAFSDTWEWDGQIWIQVNASAHLRANATRWRTTRGASGWCCSEV